jgi:hypothetical protein
MILPFLFNLGWLVMAVMGIRHRMAVMRFICCTYYCCFWPLAWLLPIAIVYGRVQAVEVFVSVFCLIGVAILLGLFVNRMYGFV